MSTRIIGGVAGGRRIRTPDGFSTRPTSDRVREALFSSLEATFGSLTGLVVLDLYAGSGAVGLEACSRGARATCVEHDRRTAGLIRENARTLGLVHLSVVASPVRRLLDGGEPRPYDVVFADPPYAMAGTEVERDLEALLRRGWLAPHATMVLERSRRDPAPRWPEGLRSDRERTYGETVLWYGRAADPGLAES